MNRLSFGVMARMQCGLPPVLSTTGVARSLAGSTTSTVSRRLFHSTTGRGLFRHHTSAWGGGLARHRRVQGDTQPLAHTSGVAPTHTPFSTTTTTTTTNGEKKPADDVIAATNEAFRFCNDEVR